MSDSGGGTINSKKPYTRILNVFLIGYGGVAGFNVGDEKPPHY
jgi:hypothetical protein